MKITFLVVRIVICEGVCIYIVDESVFFHACGDRGGIKGPPSPRFWSFVVLVICPSTRIKEGR